MNLGSKGLDPLPRLCLTGEKQNLPRRRGDTEKKLDAEL
jgi:hypothetical protein